MTDSILNAYWANTSTTYIPSPVIAGSPGALSQLGGLDGFALDATSYNTITPAAFVGGPVGGTVAVQDPVSANNLNNVALDASPLTNVNASPKFVHWNDGLLRWAPHNYVLQSQTLGTSWTATAIAVTSNDTTAPDGTVTAEKLTESNTATSQLAAASSLTLLANQAYAFSVYIKPAPSNPPQWVCLSLGDTAGPNNGCRTWFDLTGIVVGSTTNVGTGWTAGTSTIADAGSGWVRCTLVVATSGGTTFMPAFRSADGNTSTTRFALASYWAWGAQLNRGRVATPYIVTTTAGRIGIPLGYNLTTGGFGLMVEPAATPLCLQTEDLTTTWTLTNTAVTANAVAAPDSYVTADKLTETAVNSTHDITSNATAAFTANSVISCSFYAKAAEDTAVIGILADSSALTRHSQVTFDLTAVTAASTASSGYTFVNANIKLLGNGWYYCTFVTTTNTDTSVVLMLRLVKGGVSSYLGVVNEGMYLWGMQVEVNTQPTSYMPTVATATNANRAADQVALALTTIPFSATAGTINTSLVSRETNYVTIIARLFELSDGTANDTIDVRANVADTPDSFGLQVSVATVAQVVSTTTKTGSFSLSGNKVSAAWQANDFAILADGGSEVVDTAGTLPTVTTLAIGQSSPTASRELNGFIKAMSYFPTRKTQAQMQSLQASLP